MQAASRSSPGGTRGSDGAARTTPPHFVHVQACSRVRMRNAAPQLAHVARTRAPSCSPMLSPRTHDDSTVIVTDWLHTLLLAEAGAPRARLPQKQKRFVAPGKGVSQRVPRR